MKNKNCLVHLISSFINLVVARYQLLQQSRLPRSMVSTSGRHHVVTGCSVCQPACNSSVNDCCREVAAWDPHSSLLTDSKSTSTAIIHAN